MELISPPMISRRSGTCSPWPAALSPGIRVSQSDFAALARSGNGTRFRSLQVGLYMSFIRDLYLCSTPHSVITIPPIPYPLPVVSFELELSIFGRAREL
jgi:hypothetical protein